MIKEFITITVWFGVVFVRAGFYEGGVFRFTLTLPDEFPNDDVPVSKIFIGLYFNCNI